MRFFLLLLVASFLFPALVRADALDPQIDPNNCTGSLAVTFVPGTTMLQNSANGGESFSTSFLGSTSSSTVCFANLTGQTLTGLAVTTAAQPNSNLVYNCPDSAGPFFLSCAVTLNESPAGQSVTFSFSGTNADHPGIVPFTSACNLNVDAVAAGCPGEFDLLTTGFPSVPEFTASAMPEPGTLTLILSAAGTMVVYRRRRPHQAP
ncbi:MAG: hypothetical protein JO065_16025 [Acidobacteria bacterium]|nr:hypothetical protein [Acidobacteriota bacterium]